MAKAGHFIAISTQKGGGGKTSSTKFVSTIMNASGIDVCVVDVDPQESFVEQRHDELAFLRKSIEKKEDNELVRAYADLRKKGRDVFDVMQIDIFPKGDTQEDRAIEHEQNFSKIRELKELAKTKYDFVFFDFPGFTAQAEILRLLFLMDFILIPFYVDDHTIKSTVTYIQTLKKIKDSGKSSIKDFAVFFFRYSKQKNLALFKHWEEQLIRADIKVFENKIYDSAELERNRSTIVPFDLAGEKSLVPFVQELVMFCKKR